MKNKKHSLIAALLTGVLLITVLAGCAHTEETKNRTESPSSAPAEPWIGSLDDLADKRIGIVTGSADGPYVAELLPDAQITYFSTVADLATALAAGKIDAYTEDESTQRFIFREYDSFSVLTRLYDCNYGTIFPKTEAGQQLCEQMNEFLSRIQTDGTLAEIDEIWFGEDESAQTLDYEALTGENGTLKLAVCSGVGYPFVYYSDNLCVGYELDIALRFCREYGYGLTVEDYNFDGLLAAVAAGKCDFGASGITITEERSESVTFSDPTYYTGSVLVVRTEDLLDGAEETAAEDTPLAEHFAGQSIGVITGSVYDELIQKYIPGSNIEYFNSVTDMALALDSGKLAGYALDEPSAQLLFRKYPAQGIYTTLETSSYGFIFPKDSEKGDALREQVNEYLEKIRSDGTAALLEDIWFGTDERLKTVDYNSLTGENGTLNFAITTDAGVPFAYVKDNSYVGYDVDMAVHFCQEYGYNIHVTDSRASGMLASVSSGKCDFGASSVTITEERAESVSFSVPNYESSIVLITGTADITGAAGSSTNGDTVELADYFAGKTVGVLTGSVFDQLAEKYLPDSKVEYINAATDMALALDTGKISAYIMDRPQVQQMLREYGDQYIYSTLESSAYAYIFPKNTEKSNTLRRQMNEFLARIQSDGTAKELEDIWLGTDESLKTVDYSHLSGENGTLRFAISTDVGAPFVYMKDGRYAGYDVDIAVLFCREYGYGIDIIDSNISGLLASVSSGKCDFGGSTIAITEERRESLVFSEPNYISGVVIVTKQGDRDVAESKDASASGGTAKAVAALYAGKKIGILSGSAHDRTAADNLPDSERVYFNTVLDMSLALEDGTVDAYLTDSPLAQMMTETYPEHTVAAELEENQYSFVFGKNNAASDALREQFDAYITTLRSNGTASEMASLWFGNNAGAKTVELDDLTPTNGTVRFAVSTDVGAPFAYVKNGRYVGFDIDIAARFCREYGYGLEIVDTNFSGMLVAVASGKCDMGGSCIIVTEERGKTLNFSVPYYEGSVVLVAEDAGDAQELAISDPSVYEELRGKKIGVVTGMICDELAAELIPECQIEYFNSNADLALALETGKVDAYMADEPISRLLMNEYSDHRLFAVASATGYGFIFPKDSERDDVLLGQMNEFLQKLRLSGALQELDDAWFGQDETRKIVDYSGLTGENGTLSFAATSTTGEPFCYLKNEQYAGYDIDIAVRFCREYGYDLKIVDTSFSGMLAEVSSGKCDFGGSCITITEERKESVSFSDPNYTGGLVLVVKDASHTAPVPETAADSSASDYEELRGYNVGVLTGAIFDQIVAEVIPDFQCTQFNSNADLAVALETGKIDAYMTDEPVAQMLMNEYDNHTLYDIVQDDSYAYIFPKDSERGETLRAQMNEFLQDLRQSGTLDELKALWLGTDEAAKAVDRSGLTAENGTLRFVTDSSSGAPFCYIKDGECTGYDVDIAVRFCREYGYGFELVDTNFSGVLASVASGKCDFGGACVSITEERKETMLFSDPNYEGGIAIVVKAAASAEDAAEEGSVRDSFAKTFLRESRWKLFASGIGITLLITVTAAVFGTAAAFLLFLLYRKNYPAAKITVDVLSDIMQKTPVVVILMILYYIIFGKLTLDSVWVSCIGFTLIFASAVIGLLKVAVGAVDGGQMEAALALGYTDTRAFLRIILPQAMEHFLPGYMSEIVSLIKGTAVVGYIAVQDLTKISDIIRSRTYEAFFPLIATAVIYYILAWALTLLVRRLQMKINPKHRSKDSILKGVQTK